MWGGALAYGQLDKGGGDVEREQKEESSRHTQNPLDSSTPSDPDKEQSTEDRRGNENKFSVLTPT